MTDRKGFIGGSDAAACMGLSRWTTPLRLWAEKTGKVKEKDLSENEAVELGTELEDFVAKKFEKKSGLKVRRDNRDFKHPDFDFIRGHIDRRIVGTDAILECKTCSAWKEKEWKGEDIPQEYIVQLMLYMGLTERKTGYIAVLIGGQKFVWKKIDFDAEFYNKIVQDCVNFWRNYVEEDCPPAAVAGDNEILSELYVQELGEMLAPATDTKALVLEREYLKKEIAKIESRIEEIDAKLKQYIGRNAGIQGDDYRVTWKEQSRSFINYGKLKEDGLYDAYSYTNTTRTLRVSVKKEGK